MRAFDFKFGLLCCLVLLVAEPWQLAHAGPEIGRIVRIQLQDGKKLTEVTLLEVQADSLRIVIDGDDMQSVALVDIVKMESQVGVKTHARTGALVGMVVGLIVGGVLGYEMDTPLMQGDPTDPSSVDGHLDLTVIFGILGGAIGAGLGAGVGNLFEAAVWETSPAWSYRAGRPGMRVAFTFRAPSLPCR